MTNRKSRTTPDADAKAPEPDHDSLLPGPEAPAQGMAVEPAPTPDATAGKQIRKVLHQGEWWFSIIDVVEVLVGGDRPRKYWNDLKTKLASEGYDQLSEKIGQLKLPSRDGKAYFTDCANTETLFRIIQSIHSPKVEPLKRWLAKVGKERIDEIENPELSMERMQEVYEQKGYPKDWIDNQGLLHLPLPARVSGPQEIEKVGILEDLSCHVGIGRWQGGRKVGDSLALPFMGLVVHLEFQDASAPALGDRLAGIPDADFRILLPLKKADHMPPWQL